MPICDIYYCTISTPCQIFPRIHCQHEFCFSCILSRFLTHSTCPVCRDEFTHAFRWKVGECDSHEAIMPTPQDRQSAPNRIARPPTPQKKKPAETTPCRPREDVENSRLHRTPLQKVFIPVRRRLFSPEPEVRIYINPLEMRFGECDFIKVKQELQKAQADQKFQPMSKYL